MTSTTLDIVRREFPDYDLKTAFEAALTLFHLRVTTRVMQRHELSVVARYVLRAISIGVDNHEEISRILGLDTTDLAGPFAELLGARLVVQSQPDLFTGKRRLSLTEQGRGYLQEGKQLLVPRQRTFHLHFDPLTRELVPEQTNISQVETVRKEGIFVIPARNPKPTLGDIHLQAFREALAADPRYPDDIEVISLLDMTEPYVEYARGIDVFALEHRDTKELRFAAFKGAQYAPGLSEAIQRLHTSGTKVIPADAELEETAQPTIERLVPPEAIDTTHQIVEKDQQLHEIQQQLETQKIAHSTTQSSAERSDLQAEIDELEERLKATQGERDQLNEALQTTTAGTSQVLRTEEHRPLLEKALREATSEVIVISPWMNTRTVDEGLCALMNSAMRRGVQIRIGYGYGFERDPSEAERHRQRAKDVQNLILSRTRFQPRHLLEITNIGNTHQKILICDRSFAVSTSFNWLSYRGNMDSEYRHETGILVSAPTAVEDLAQTALAAIEEGKSRYQSRG